MQGMVSIAVVCVGVGLLILGRLWSKNRPAQSIARVVYDVEREAAQARRQQ